MGSEHCVGEENGDDVAHFLVGLGGHAEDQQSHGAKDDYWYCDVEQIVQRLAAEPKVDFDSVGLVKLGAHHSAVDKVPHTVLTIVVQVDRLKLRPYL